MVDDGSCWFETECTGECVEVSILKTNCAWTNENDQCGSLNFLGDSLGYCDGLTKPNGVDFSCYNCDNGNCGVWDPHKCPCSVTSKLTALNEIWPNINHVEFISDSTGCCSNDPGCCDCSCTQLGLFECPDGNCVETEACCSTIECEEDHCGKLVNECDGSVINCGQCEGENFECSDDNYCFCKPITPETCPYNNCGLYDDGCGGMVDCGGCGLSYYCSSDSSGTCIKCEGEECCPYNFVFNCDENKHPACCPVQWVDDGWCEDGVGGVDVSDTYGDENPWYCDLTCYSCTEFREFSAGEFCVEAINNNGNDGGDCDVCDNSPGNCCEGYVANCNYDPTSTSYNSDPCCLVEWVSDGRCDGNNQQWGCDLTCYSCVDIDNTNDCVEVINDGGLDNNDCECFESCENNMCGFWDDDCGGITCQEECPDGQFCFMGYCTDCNYPYDCSSNRCGTIESEMEGCPDLDCGYDNCNDDEWCDETTNACINCITFINHESGNCCTGYVENCNVNQSDTNTNWTSHDKVESKLSNMLVFSVFNRRFII